MEHIVWQEGINTKKNKQSGGIFEDLMKNVIKTRKTEKSCLINLSCKGVDMVACENIRFSSLFFAEDVSAMKSKEKRMFSQAMDMVTG